MNDKEIEILTNLIEGENSIFIDARFGDGIKDEDLNYFIEIIKKIKENNQSRKMIEKQLFYLLIDIVPSLLGCVDLYEGKLKEGFINQISLIQSNLVECFSFD